jgi:predicted PurR-regulated permease PerM
MPAKESNHFLISILLVFLGLVVLLFTKFLAPLVFGILLAGFAFPLYTRLTAFFRGKENIASLITVLLLALLIILPFTGILTLLAREAFQFVGAYSENGFMDAAKHIADFLSDTFNIDAETILSTQVIPALKNASAAIYQELGGLLSNALQLTLNFFVMIVTAFYMLRDGKEFGKFLISLSPLKTVDELTIYRTFKETGLAVFYGNFISALTQGVLGGIGFFLFGIESPVLWGTVMAFLALIPFLGPYLVFVPAAAYLFLTGNTGTGIAFVIYNLLIVSTIDNILKPELLSSRMNIHPLPTLLAILGGLKVFGILGIIYGPLIFATFMAILKVYLAHIRGKDAHQAA